MNNEFFDIKVFKLMPDLRKVECSLDEFGFELMQIRMPDDSMIRAGVRPGDILCFERSSKPDDGDFVICEIGDVYTLRQFRIISSDRVDLISHGASSEHHIVNRNAADIAGKLSYVMEIGKAMDLDDLLDGPSGYFS